MERLYKEDIILINRLTLKRHGGNFVPPFNFLHESALDYLIEAVQAEMFGKQLYPEVYQKAGLYMFNIISNHIFQDGNKRTGLESALLFLRLNGFELKNGLKKIDLKAGTKIPSSGKTDNELLFGFTMEIASGQVDLEGCQRWFKENIIEAEN